MIKERDIAKCLLLSVVTCGIYSILWFIRLTDDAEEACGSECTPGGKSLLFSLISCGIYSYYWAYQQGERIADAKQKLGIGDGSSRGVLYLILHLTGLGIVSYALMQSELNEIAQAQDEG